MVDDRYTAKKTHIFSCNFHIVCPNRCCSECFKYTNIRQPLQSKKKSQKLGYIYSKNKPKEQSSKKKKWKKDSTVRLETLLLNCVKIINQNLRHMCSIYLHINLIFKNQLICHNQTINKSILFCLSVIKLPIEKSKNKEKKTG